MTDEEKGLTLIVGEIKGELKGVKEAMQTFANEMKGFRDSFDSLEKGRLSKLEIEFANLIGKLTIIAIVVSGLVSFASILIQKYLFGG